MTHRIFNKNPADYLLELDVPGIEGLTCDLAIVEFDDHGTLWDLEQMNAAVALIRRRNVESQRGVLVLVFVHGWKHNADPRRSKGNLASFRQDVQRIAQEQCEAGAPLPDRVVGVYLGWRGASNRFPVLQELTFWARRVTAERLSSVNMRETLFRVMHAARERPESKCVVVGHSMGGLIVGKTLSPSLTTLLLTSGEQGARMPADLVLLANPALDALASWQFVDFLKRSKATLELRTSSGETSVAPGPIVVSITSEVDSATGRAYPFGRTISSMFLSYRKDHAGARPSQRYLSTHTEGHVDLLVSHRARVENGEVVLERVPGAYNDTPFWIIRTTAEICRDHSDLENPLFGALVDKVMRLNRVFEVDLQSWVRTRR